MAFAEIALGAQILGGFFQSSSERKALSAQLDVLREQLEYEREGVAGLERLAAEKSQVMAAAHEKRMEQIGVSEAAAERRARGYGRRAGHAPGARGLKWQARREFEQARTEESLGYGAAEERRERGLLTAAAGMRRGGGSTAAAIAGTLGQKGRVTSSFLGDVGESLGWYAEGKKPKAAATVADKPKPPVTVDPREFALAPPPRLGERQDLQDMYQRRGQQGRWSRRRAFRSAY